MAISLISGISVVLLVIAALGVILGLIKRNDTIVKVSLIAFCIMFLMQLFILPLML